MKHDPPPIDGIQATINRTISSRDTDGRIVFAHEDHHLVFDDAVRRLARYAGAFNQLTWQERQEIIHFLADLGMDAADGVLEALIDQPRTEQIDLTKAFFARIKR